MAFLQNLQRHESVEDLCSPAKQRVRKPQPMRVLECSSRVGPNRQVFRRSAKQDLVFEKNLELEHPQVSLL
jgi:hypothetical protein